MYQPAIPVSGCSVSPFQLRAAGLLSTASELAAGVAPRRPQPVALPAWPTLPGPRRWLGLVANKDVGKGVAKLAVFVLLAPHLLGIASTVVGRAGRPSLRPSTVAPVYLPVGQPAPMPTMTDGGADYGG
jgi:hypothetical protein